MVFNGNEWYFQIPYGVSLRLASVPLRTSVVLNGIQIVMNGISKYHSGIIDTGKCTIEGLNGTEWYSMVFPNTIQGTIETDRYTIEGFNGTEWY